MKPFFRKKENRSLDVGTSRSKWSIPIPFLSRRGRGTVNLREKLYVKYPLEVLAGIGVIIVVVFLMKSAFTKAEVTTFNPATCLGTWQNPAAAQGVPETFGVDGAVPSAENSAVYTESPSYVFCGNFLPPESEFEATGTIQSVGLTFVWDIRDASASMATGSEGSEETTGTTGTEETPDTTPPASFRNIPFGFLVHPVYAQEEPPVDPAPATEPAAPTPEEQTAPAVLPGPTEPAPPEEPSAPAPDVVLPAPDEPVTSEDPLDETIPVTAEATTTTPTGEEATSTASTTEEVVTYEPPAPPSDAFLKVSYTLNGTTWFELTRVNLSNWPNLTLSIPITSWEELANLQVSVEEISTTLLPPYPKIFLDGMSLEVTYERPIPPEEQGGGAVFDPQNEDTTVVEPGDQIDITSDLFGDFLTEPPASGIGTKPMDTGAAPQDSMNSVVRAVNPEARHSCSFEPFSLGVQAGRGSAVFTMTLAPSRPNSPFEVEVGNLPLGVTASINRASGVGTFRPRITLSAENSAVLGSYTITVFYNEAQNGGGTLTSACKLNLIVE
jgi:hypothetical protein